MHFIPLLKLNMTCAVDFVTSTSADNQSFTFVGGVSRFSVSAFQLGIERCTNPSLFI